MKLFKILFLALGFTALSSFAQGVPIDELPIATINNSYLVTVPEIPIQEFYYIDISHLSFLDEVDALKKLNFYLTANLIRPVINLEENYVILQVMFEYIDGETDYTLLQNYLNHLTKPVE